MGGNDPIVIVAGPTACGKSALAMDVAEEFNGTVINADSMQVYRELRVLTARPSLQDETRVPHKLYGVLAASERCSVGRWLDLARTAIEECRADGRLPIVVGGTGMYLKALAEGLSEIPEIAVEVRQQATTLHGQLGGEGFRAELAKRDPAAAQRLPAGDTQRLIRAYEVVEATGRTMDDWHAEASDPPIEGRFTTIALIPPREAIYAACDGRFDAMVEGGALEEVKSLLALGLDPDLPSMKAVGLRELGGYLAGETSLEAAKMAAQQATRNYAKRQLTWLRRQVETPFAINTQYSESLSPEIFSFIRQFVLTSSL